MRRTGLKIIGFAMTAAILGCGDTSSDKRTKQQSHTAKDTGESADSNGTPHGPASDAPEKSAESKKDAGETLTPGKNPDASATFRLPELKAAPGTNELGAISIELIFPRETSKYTAVMVRATAGEVPPADTCKGADDETIRKLTSFDDVAFDYQTKSPGKVFSFRACVYGAGNTLIGSTTQAAVEARREVPGTLDKNFANNGTNLVTSVFESTPLGSPGVVAKPMGLAVQKDGRILTCGTGFTVSRFEANGSVDAGFGTDGSVENPFRRVTQNLPVFCTAIGIQKDGKIIIGGTSSHRIVVTGGVGLSFTVYSAFVVARLMPDGSIDTTFASNGLAVVRPQPGFLNTDDVLLDLKIQPDDKIVAVGYSKRRNESATKGVLARLTADGATDSGFATNGIVLDDRFSVMNSVAIGGGGAIVVGGSKAEAADKLVALVGQYKENGNTDPLFGNAGLTANVFGMQPWSAVLSVGLDGKNRLVIGGFSGVSSASFQATAARILKDGKPDVNFNSKGLTIIAEAGATASIQSLFTDSAGEIVAGGYANKDAGRRAFLVRLKADGRLRPDFGAKGVLNLDMAQAGSDSEVAAMTFLPALQFVTAGYAGGEMFIRKYWY